jgi:hypothetical protein
MIEQNLNFEQEIPFINTRYGLVFGNDCVNEKVKRFNGELSEVSVNELFFTIKSYKYYYLVLDFLYS